MSEYIIADWLVRIEFAQESSMDAASILPSFVPFRATGSTEGYEHLTTITVDYDLKPYQQDRRQHIRIFDTGNAHIAVDRLPDGGYQYVIHDMAKAKCALLIASADFSAVRCNLRGTEAMRRFGLNNAVMLAYAFAGARRHTLLIHASLVRADGIAYAFIARSGTGKSTQTANWLKVIPNTDLMNDDNPVIRIVNGQVIAYGSPWSGKTPCYRQTSAPLGAVTQISRAQDNHVERLTPLQAFAYLLPACSTMKWERAIHGSVCDSISALIAAIPVYVLHCTPHPESAVVCHEVVKKGVKVKG